MSRRTPAPAGWQLARRDLPGQERARWRQQRYYGLGRAVQPRAEGSDLARLLGWSGTPSGRRQLRRRLRQALPVEYRQLKSKQSCSPARKCATSKLARWACAKNRPACETLC
jgi:hypothetical protein